MASKCKGYAGKIKNQGTQFVQAPFGGSDSRKGNVKITGTDLRTGKSRAVFVTDGIFHLVQKRAQSFVERVYRFANFA